MRDRQQNTTHRMDHKYVDDLSKKLFNKWAATVATNDLFLPWNTSTYLEEEYHLDRGIAFEQSFNANTSYLEKPLSAYKEPEYEGLIPRMFLSTHINDGRVFYLNPHPIRYLIEVEVQRILCLTMKQMPLILEPFLSSKMDETFVLYLLFV